MKPMNPTTALIKNGGGWLRRTATITGAVLTTWSAGLLATARAEQTTSPPEADSPWLAWLLVFAFAGLCIGIAFKNPKRSHQN